MLKTDFHLHAGEDKHHKLKYSSKKLIEIAAKKGFEVLALTFHGEVYYNKELSLFAKRKGILLISGIEKAIEGKEVLIYNITQEESLHINTFEDLRTLRKKKDILVIAPHPFFKRSNCLKNKLIENIDLFDAIEYSHFYTSFLNLNKKAVKVAKKHNKALIGTSDCHFLVQLEMTYSMIDSEKNLKNIFSAIRNSKVELKTNPVSLKYFLWRNFMIIFDLE